MRKGSRKPFVLKEYLDRFWSRVNKDGAKNCWEWTAGHYTDGYGAFFFYGRRVKAHRFSMELHLEKPVPEGFDVLHHCDNRSCVNPEHLYLGTDKDNHRDATLRGRIKTKLTVEKVKKIRRLHKAGWNFSQLGRRFKISAWTAARAVYRESWSHVK